MTGASIAIARIFILAISDEPELRRLLKSFLEANGYRVVATTAAGEHQYARANPDLVIVDVNHADPHVLARTKGLFSQAEVIGLFNHYNEADCIAALDIGADYLEKPFNTQELLARIRIALQRGLTARSQQRFYRSANLIVDTLELSVRRNGKHIRLTASELRILSLLAREAGRAVSYQQVLNALGRSNSLNQRRTLRGLISRLRHKLEEDPRHPTVLLTESRIGYRLATPSK